MFVELSEGLPLPGCQGVREQAVPDKVGEVGRSLTLQDFVA